MAQRRGQSCTIVFTTNAAGNSVVEIAPGFNGCLLSTRELPDSVFFSLLNSDTLDLINSSNEIQLSFSSKGNPGNQRILVISHPQTTMQKCVQIQGLLGGILSGNYDATAQECEAQ